METTPLIDWTDDQSHLLLNPRMPDGERARLERLVPGLPGHIWLATSGTTGAIKLAGLSKRAMLTSAAAVNRRFASDASDVWCCPLPTFHVGGLSIHARAFLSGARVTSIEWDAGLFASLTGVTLASLVPAQVSDLVAVGLRAPASLRAVIVGGGALRPALYESARALGWPVLPSYGMTECCSQIATAVGDSPELVLFDHVEVRTEPDDRLALRSGSLLTGYATENGLVDPKVGGWLVTEDLGSVRDGILEIRGRRGDFVKIGGESVDLARLDRILAEIATEAAVFPIPDDRLGSVIGLAVVGEQADHVVQEFNARVMPYERPRKVITVAAIPRTALGKLMRERLLELVE